MLKSEARKIFAQKRNAVSLQQKIKWDDLILIRFQTLGLPSVHSLFTYAAMDHEPATDAITDYLSFINPGLQIAYPVSDFVMNDMQAVLTNEATHFSINDFGIPEPEIKDAAILTPADIDLVIVPLLCFDEKGYRTGYGKGFYDKYLAQTTSRTLKIGLSYFEPVNEIEDRNEFDVPLTHCITPGRVYEF